MKVDLHCHSYFSDGKHAPAALIRRAIENQLTHLAITDHDCTAALDAIDIQDCGIELLSGVEISCDWNGLEIHIVGLFFDHRNEQLSSLLASQQQSRRTRIQAIAARLEAIGHDGLMLYLQDLPCLVYTRSHVADFLVANGICKNRQKAFKSYLGKRGRIYIAAQWCSLDEAVAAITNAGGVAVLAHPGRYPLSRRKLESLVGDFSIAGGEALEASYSNIDPRTQQYLSELSLARNLYISAGSDFHDAAASWTDIGRFPALDQQAKKNAIWLHPKWHSLMR